MSAPNPEPPGSNTIDSKDDSDGSGGGSNLYNPNNTLSDRSDRQTQLIASLSLLLSRLDYVNITTQVANIRAESAVHANRIRMLIAHVAGSILLPAVGDACWRDVDAALEALEWMLRGDEGEEWVVMEIRVLQKEREELRRARQSGVRSFHDQFVKYIDNRERELLRLTTSRDGKPGSDVQQEEQSVENPQSKPTSADGAVSTQSLLQLKAINSDGQNHVAAEKYVQTLNDGQIDEAAGPLHAERMKGLQLMGEAESDLEMAAWESLDQVKWQFEAEIGKLIMKTEEKIDGGMY